MQGIIHTNLYGEKNFNVINIAIQTNNEIYSVGYANDKFECPNVNTRKRFRHSDFALLAPNGEIVLRKAYGLDSIKELYFRLGKLIKLLKATFSADDEFYFTYHILFSEGKSKYKQLYDLIKKHDTTEYSIVCLKQLYFKETVPMKISDFEAVYKELKKPTYNHSVDALDEFVAAQNEMIMKSFLNMMTHVVDYGQKGSLFQMHDSIRVAVRFAIKDDIFKLFYEPDFKAAFINAMKTAKCEQLDELQRDLDEFCSAVELMRKADYLPNMINIYERIPDYSKLYNV